VPVPATAAIHSGLVSSHHIRSPDPKELSKRPNISGASVTAKTPPTQAGEVRSSSRVAMWSPSR
jgi:hypothetical protein